MNKRILFLALSIAVCKTGTMQQATTSTAPESTIQELLTFFAKLEQSIENANANMQSATYVLSILKHISRTRKAPARLGDLYAQALDTYGLLTENKTGIKDIVVQAARHYSFQQKYADVSTPPSSTEKLPLIQSPYKELCDALEDCYNSTTEHHKALLLHAVAYAYDPHYPIPTTIKRTLLSLRCLEKTDTDVVMPVMVQDILKRCYVIDTVTRTVRKR